MVKLCVMNDLEILTVLTTFMWTLIINIIKTIMIFILLMQNILMVMLDWDILFGVRSKHTVSKTLFNINSIW